MSSADGAEGHGRPEQAVHGAVRAAVRAALPATGHPLTVLIDGPSGAGKSTLADGVQAWWPGPRPTLVRMDDIYPGWQGLDAAAEQLASRVLLPRREGRAARWRRYDWVREEPAEWHEVDPERTLIVEGCGTLARANTATSDIRVWIDADDALRKQRALARDGALFAAHWDVWQAQWEAWCDRESPERQATVRLLAR